MKQINCCKIALMIWFLSQEWEKIWEAGIEVGGRFELGQAVNSSIYYILR